MRRTPWVPARAPCGAVGATGHGAEAHISRPGPLLDGVLRLPVQPRTRSRPGQPATKAVLTRLWLFSSPCQRSTCTSTRDFGSDNNSPGCSLRAWARLQGKHCSPSVIFLQPEPSNKINPIRQLISTGFGAWKMCCEHSSAYVDRDDKAVGHAAALRVRDECIDSTLPF